MGVTIVVATFGDPAWITLARARAIPSALAQDVPVIHEHGDTLAAARNQGIERADTEWVIALDADDELAPGYCTAMMNATTDIRAPRLIEVDPAGVRTEVLLADRNIEKLNPVPVSAAVRRDMVLDAGGFQEWPAFEDWALWLRLVRNGATVEHVDDAVLLAHTRPDSRNRTVAKPRLLMAEIRASA